MKQSFLSVIASSVIAADPDTSLVRISLATAIKTAATGTVPLVLGALGLGTEIGDIG